MLSHPEVDRRVFFMVCPESKRVLTGFEAEYHITEEHRLKRLRIIDAGIAEGQGRSKERERGERVNEAHSPNSRRKWLRFAQKTMKRHFIDSSNRNLIS